MSNLIENIKESEGYRGETYKDSQGYDTIGYGTRLPITEKEAEILLNFRLSHTIVLLRNAKSIVNVQTLERQDVLFEMAYQLGVEGALKFKKMWAALERADYKGAADEMIDSLWYFQTPNRVKKLAAIMAG